MPLDWQRILELVPLAMARPGSLQGAAMLRGYQESMERRRREQLQQQQLGMQQQGQQRQDELAQAQMANLQADNARGDQQLQFQQAQQALNRIAAYRREDTGTLGELAQTPETALAPEATPLSAQNDLTVQRLSAQQDYGVPPGTSQGPLPNMTQAVSNRDKRLAQQVLDRIDKNPLYAGYQGKPELEELSIQFKGGETKKVRELRALAGGMLLGPDGQPVPMMPKAPSTATPGSFEEYVGLPSEQQTLRRGQRKGWMQADDRPPAGQVTRYQAKEIVNDQGQTVMANFDAMTGKYSDPATGQPIAHPKPVPSNSVQLDATKFAKAKPVLEAVSELSGKINTGRGVLAKVRGGVERAKAQVNLNDDIAEYEALVSGFTPLVARALGHTGVLTQQDVDSVRALFPKPGDSQSLRDRKIGRVLSIVGQLEGGIPPPAASPMTNPFRPRP